MPYSILSSPLKDQHFPKIVWRTGQRLFFFLKFYNLLTKRATRELFDYYGIVHKEEK